MKHLVIDETSKDQRLDRFLMKYLNKAGKSFIQKQIRLKKIKVNKKKAEPSTFLKLGDVVNIYMYDEKINELRESESISSLDFKDLVFIYEDENLSILYKREGLLVHAASKDDYGKNLLDKYVNYLIKNGEYIPRLSPTFTPAFCNRLDLNTSGLIIACKNYETLKKINLSIKKRNIEKRYRTIVSGEVKADRTIELSISKKDNKNMMEVSNDGKDCITEIFPIISKNGYTLLDINLITGRTHQIRLSLSEIDHPIIGDRKYGKRIVNENLYDKYGLRNQYLIAYKLKFGDMEKGLEYLNNKEFKIDNIYYGEIEKKLLGDFYEL